MSRQHRRTIGVSIFNMLVALFSFVAMLTSSVNAATPSTVNKLTIAMDSWGSDMIDPWEYPKGSIIQSYLNLRLVTRDENMQIQPLWAVEWSQNDQGIDIALHPKAVCQNAEQADAELLKADLQGTTGLIEGFKGGLYAGRLRGLLEAFEVRGPRQLFIKTKSPDPGSTHGSGWRTSEMGDTVSGPETSHLVLHGPSRVGVMVGLIRSSDM